MSRRLVGQGLKSWHPRHATQSAEAANRQERAIEKKERQAARAEIHEESRRAPPCGASVYGECDCPKCQGLET